MQLSLRSTLEITPSPPAKTSVWTGTALTASAIDALIVVHQAFTCPTFGDSAMSSTGAVNISADDIVRRLSFRPEVA